MSEQEVQMSDDHGDHNQEESSMEATSVEQSGPQNGDSSNQVSAEEDERKLFCGGLSFEITEADLKSYFEKYGDIEQCVVKIDPMTKKSRGFGFVTFGSKQALEDALSAGPHTIKGKQIDPKTAKAKPGAKKVFCGGLPPETTEEEIRTYFGQYGNIESLELPMDKEKTQRRAFIFITYETVAAADAAIKKPKQTINGKECDVKKAVPKIEPKFGGYVRGSWGGYTMRGGRGASRGGRGGRGDGGYGYGNYNAYGYGGYGDYGYNYGGGWEPQTYGGSNWQQGGSYGKHGRGARSGSYHPYRY